MKIICTFYILIFLTATSVFAEVAGSSAIGPFGGIITSIVEDNQGNILIGTEGGGIYKSSNKGNTWLSLSSGLSDPFVYTMAVSMRDNSIFAGTKTGIFRSIDNGNNWNKESGTFTGNLIPFITSDRDGIIYASVWGSGVYKKDRGEWTLLNQELQNTFVNSISFNKKGDAIAATEGGIYKIEKGDRKWRFVGLIEYILPSIAIDKNDHIYVSVWGSGILRSTNSGKDWDYASIGISSYVRFLSVSPEGVIYGATEDGVFEFIPERKEWEDRGLTGIILRNVRAAKDKGLWAGSYGKGIFLSLDNGAKWQAKNRGISNTQIKSIFIDKENSILTGTSWGLFIKNMKQFKWDEIDTFAGKSVNAVIKDNEGNIYAGTTNGVFKYDATTKKWDRVFGGAAYLNITALSIDNTGLLYAGTDGDGLFISTDKGKSWEEIDNGITNKRITAIKFDSTDRLYVGTYDGIFNGVSHKKDSTWVFENITNNLKNTIVLSITAVNNNVYVGTDGGGVYVKRNGSNLWTETNNGLLNKRIYSLFDDQSGNIYAGTSDGVFLMRHGNFEWKDVSDDIINRTIQTIASDKEGNILLGTWGGGIVKMSPRN